MMELIDREKELARLNKEKAKAENGNGHVRQPAE